MLSNCRLSPPVDPSPLVNVALLRPLAIDERTHPVSPENEATLASASVHFSQINPFETDQHCVIL